MSKLITNDALNELLNLDKSGCNVLTETFKSIVHDLENDKVTFQNYSALKKLSDIISAVLDEQEIKESALRGFMKEGLGSKTEMFYGMKVSHKVTTEYDYSKDVLIMEEEVKKLKEIIKAKKLLERNDGTAKQTGTSETLSFTKI